MEHRHSIANLHIFIHLYGSHYLDMGKLLCFYAVATIDRVKKVKSIIGDFNQALHIYTTTAKLSPILRIPHLDFQ